MTPLETLRATLGIASPWETQHGASWLDCAGISPRTLAAAMNACGARFITITAYELPESAGFRLEYHWDLAGQLLGFLFTLTGNSTQSIYDLCEAADWIEREIHEEYALEFSGRACEPLLLRTGDAPGVNLREPIKPVSAPSPEVAP